MTQTAMKIDKVDVRILLLSALGGFLLVFFSLAGRSLGMAVLVGLVFGLPSGIGGGALACIFLRYLGKK